MDYESKWVKATTFLPNDAQVVVRFLKKNIFIGFGTLRVIISDEGSHFFNKQFKALPSKYVVKHIIITPYHPYTNRQMEVLNKELKQILEKTVNVSRKD